jgi:hypothetical protein
MMSIGDTLHHPRTTTEVNSGRPYNERRGCKARSKPWQRNHVGETPPHLLQIATCQGLQGNVFKKHMMHKARPPPDSKILGFHPEYLEDNGQPHDASRKGTSSKNINVVAQIGKGFPSAKLPAYYTGYKLSPEQHPDRRPTCGLPVPRCPHHRGHRPAPEPRPPTSKAPASQGCCPGVPARCTAEPKKTNETSPVRAPNRRDHERGSSDQIDVLQPPWLLTSLDMRGGGLRA